MYRDIARKIEDGTLRDGDTLPSMKDLSTRYHVGLRTVRDVLSALRTDGYIATEERKRATVTHRTEAEEDVEATARRVLAGKQDVLESLKALELIMPPLFYCAAQHCSESEIGELCRAVKGKEFEVCKGDWRLSRSSLVLHGLLNKTGNPLLSECYASLERISIVSVHPSFESPYEKASIDSGNTLPWIFESLKSKDFDEVQYRFGSMYSGTAAYIESYFEELAAAYPYDGPREFAYEWDAKAGKSYVYAQVARDMVSRMAVGEYVDGEALPSIAALSEEYGASPSTIQKTLGMLNTMGVVETVNGRGSRVRLSNVRLDPRSVADKVFMRDVDVFVNAAKMVCVILPAVVNSVSDDLGGVERDALAYLSQKTGEWVVPSALTESLIAHIPIRPLRVVMTELNDLLIWGHFLMFMGPSEARRSELLSYGYDGIDALRERDLQGFSDAMAGYYRCMFAAVQQFFAATRRANEALADQ